MSSRVINDPSALGWEYDPATGRWEVKVVQNGGANKRLLVKAQNISFLLSAAEMAQAKRMNPPKGNE